MFPGLLTFSTAILGDFCSSIAIDIGKKKTLSFLEEQGEPIINHHLARALIRALSGSLIEQFNVWCETSEGKQNKDYASFAIKQLQVILDETNQKDADWTEFLEKFNSTSLNQALERIHCNQPIQASDLGKKAIESLNGFFSDPSQNQKALSNFCDFLCKEDGALFNCNLYKCFREEIIKDPVTFNDFTIDFLSQIYTGIENAFPNSKAIADTLSNITISLYKIDAKVGTVEKKIDTVPEKVVELLQASCIPIKNGEQREQIPKMLTHYNPSELPKYPKKLKKFVTENRADELRKALTYLETHRILLISGVGGVGKSTFARALVELRPSTVPEPFWFSFYKNQDAKLGDILEKLATYMNASEIASFKDEKREPGNSDVYRLTGELYKRSEIWFVFDDLGMVLDDQCFTDKGTEFFFSSLRDNTHNAKVITTSRILPVLESGESLIDEDDDEEKQHLNGLSKYFAVDYLANNGLDNFENQILEKLAIGVNGHPLALKLLVKLVKDYGAADILSDLSRYQEEKEDTIKKAKKLFDKLAGTEKELLERISVYREPVKWKGLKEMFTENTPENADKKLRDKSLLETDHNGNYWLHPLVQEFSYKDLKNKKEAHLTAYNYYKNIDIPQSPTTKEDLQPAIEAHYHACEAGEYDLAAYIISKFNLQNFLDLWGHPKTLIEIYDKLLPYDHFKGEPILKNKKVHGIVLGNIGNEYRNMGEIRKAFDYFKHSLIIAREIGDKCGECYQLGNLGIVCRNMGKTKRSIDYFKKTLEIAREIGDKRSECITLGEIGLSYRYFGDTKKAIECHEQSLIIAREIGEKRGECNQLGNLGIVYRNMGKTKEAIDYFNQALKIAKEIGDRRGERNQLGNIGNICMDLDEPKKAIDYFEQSLLISREMYDRRYEGVDLGNLGNAYYSVGDTKTAIDYYEQALKIDIEIGDKRGECNQLGNLGNAYYSLGDAKKAIDHYEQALKIDIEIGDMWGEGVALGNLGIAYKNLGDAEKAIEFLNKSLSIGKSIQDPRIINLCEQKLKELEGFK